MVPQSLVDVNSQSQQHIKDILQFAESCQALSDLKDKYPPQLKPEDGTQFAYVVSPQVAYYFTTKVFIKREPHKDELGIDIYGNPQVNPYIAARIRNEAACLQFISENTTIPVPKFLDLWEENGLFHVKMAFVQDGIELGNIKEPYKSAALKAVTEQMETEILPQLQRLRRNFIGSPDSNLPVIPPRRLWKWKDDRVWPSMKRPSDDYVFCHTDLDQQNILINPDTFKIVSIIDWEGAGFFPQEMEILLWKFNSKEEKHLFIQTLKEHELSLFKFSASS